jgi:hypothetical protein
MENPLDIERGFNQVNERLNTIASLRYRWEIIADFLSDVGRDIERFDTYVLQLSSKFPVINNPLSYTGTDPSGLISVVELLVRCEQNIPKLNKQSRYVKARDALVESTCLLLAFTGQFKKLVQLYHHVNDEPDISDIGWIIEVHKSEEIGNFEKLGALADGAHAKGFHGLGKLLDKLFKIWKNLLDSRSHTILIPVVEQTASNYGTEFGRLRRLNVRVSNEIEREKDRIRNNFGVIGAEKSDTELNGTVASALRSRLHKKHPELQNQYFDIMFSYEMQGGWQIGSSSGAGAASISYCAILDYTGGREKFVMDSNIVITGKLDERGKILTVDEKGIKAKTEAAFFSWSEVLVVPDKQKDLFIEELAQLQSDYPARAPITLIGITHLDDLFFDRRVSTHIVESRTTYYLKKAWEKKFSVAGVLLIAGLLIVIARLWYGPIDKNPVHGIFQGNKLIVENQYGQTLANFDAGYRSEASAKNNSSNGSSPQVQLVDINDDSINEVIWTTNASKSGSEVEKMKCWSITGDSLVWEKPALFDIEFPRKNGMVDDHFFWQQFFTETMPDGQTRIIIGLSMRTMFPAMIASIDAKSGNVTSKYLHTGQISDIELLDLRGDDKREVVFSGVNNAFAMAAVGVLDITDIQGHSPLKGDYIIEGFEKADEIHYLLVPKTKVGKYFDPVVRYNGAQLINFSEDNKLVSVRIKDGPSQSFAGITKPMYIIAYFDFDFQPAGFSTSDQYDIASEKLLQTNKIASKPDYDYFEAFKDSVMYWNGQQFVLRDDLSGD